MDQDSNNVRQDRSPTLSTLNSNITQQQFQTQTLAPRNCGPQQLPDFSTHTTPHNSFQPGPFKTFATTTNMRKTTQPQLQTANSQIQIILRTPLHSPA